MPWGDPEKRAAAKKKRDERLETLQNRLVLHCVKAFPEELSHGTCKIARSIHDGTVTIKSGKQQTLIVHPRNIKSISLIPKTHDIVKRKSGTTGALVGGLIGGTEGAIVGGLATRRKVTKTVRDDLVEWVFFTENGREVTVYFKYPFKTNPKRWYPEVAKVLGPSIQE